MAPILHLLPDMYLCSLIFTGGDAPTGAVTTFVLRNLSEPTPAAVGADVAAQYVANGLADHQSDELTCAEVHVKQGPVEDGPFATTGIGVDGNIAATAQGPQVSWLVTKNASEGGRRNRGRMFWPGVPENFVGVGGVIPGVTAAAFNTDLTTFFAGLQGDGHFHVLAHRHDPDEGETPVAPTDVDSVTVQTRVATQRRRMRR